MKNSKLTSVFAALVLIAAFPFAAPAAANDNPPTPVGSWEAIFVFDGDERIDVVVGTFNREGTLTSSGPGFNAHGVWKRSGPRTFSAKSIFFIYDPDTGEAILKAEGLIEAEVSLDGQSQSGTLAAEFQLLDGTVVDTLSATFTGTRITLE